MISIAKNNPVLASIDIFPVEPEQQHLLVDSLIDDIKTAFKQQPGFVAAAVHRSRDGLRVVNYVQWQTQNDYEAYINNSEIPSLSSRLSAFPAPNSQLYEIFISEPADSQMTISTNIQGLINFGIFKLRNPQDQPHFLDATKEAVQLVARQPGLVTTHFHRSLDGAMAVNYGIPIMLRINEFSSMVRLRLVLCDDDGNVLKQTLIALFSYVRSCHTSCHAICNCLWARLGPSPGRALVQAISPGTQFRAIAQGYSQKG